MTANRHPRGDGDGVTRIRKLASAAEVQRRGGDMPAGLDGQQRLAWNSAMQYEIHREKESLPGGDRSLRENGSTGSCVVDVTKIDAQATRMGGDSASSVHLVSTENGVLSPSPPLPPPPPLPTFSPFLAAGEEGDLLSFTERGPEGLVAKPFLPPGGAEGGGGGGGGGGRDGGGRGGNTSTSTSTSTSTIQLSKGLIFQVLKYAPVNLRDPFLTLQKIAPQIGPKIAPKLVLRELVNRHAALVSGMLYCLMSCSMLLLNKAVLSGYRFPATNSFLLYQNLIGMVLVLLGGHLGLLEFEPLTWKLCKVWFPVNCLFVGMVVSGLHALRHLTVPMVTILKNLTNVITALGEMALFRKQHTAGVWSALGLIVLSSICGGSTDLAFAPKGYLWQAINCVLSAGYALYLKQAMELAKEQTPSGTLSEVSMVLLNNALSLPLGLALVILSGETQELAASPLLRDLGFWASATLTGLLGACLCFSVMWFLHSTGPTTYGLVGSLNKIPTTVVGGLLFPAKTTLPNSLSVGLGLLAGVAFTMAKLQQRHS
ncbi:hypothetical protein CBR_g23506 [Chara braunii]|uniref:Sugar phosphate transporter domain-containing protein n=1 Tax=Chara braunii TaxID=69332 RepID=A0A388L4E5_CHABU|nr:hypothetical protein CBR_g23506 [Chara braunii]|eukprot:GBG77180.1 hypothetical protein CBR_g23506 [Chara braunii]